MTTIKCNNICITYKYLVKNSGIWHQSLKQANINSHESRWRRFDTIILKLQSTSKYLVEGHMHKTIFSKCSNRKDNLNNISKLLNEVFLQLTSKNPTTQAIIHVYFNIPMQRKEGKMLSNPYFILREKRGKEIQTGKKLIVVKNSVKYIIVADKFKPLKRPGVQREFNFISTDR